MNRIWISSVIVAGFVVVLTIACSDTSVHPTQEAAWARKECRKLLGRLEIMDPDKAHVANALKLMRHESFTSTDSIKDLEDEISKELAYFYQTYHELTTEKCTYGNTLEAAPDVHVVIRDILPRKWVYGADSWDQGLSQECESGEWIFFSPVRSDNSEWKIFVASVIFIRIGLDNVRFIVWGVWDYQAGTILLKETNWTTSDAGYVKSFGKASEYSKEISVEKNLRSLRTLGGDGRVLSVGLEVLRISRQDGSEYLLFECPGPRREFYGH